MKTIGFFNNKGGVGKTSLVYHVAYMLGWLGCRVIAADLDPQANLTSMFLSEERLEELWEQSPRPTLHGAVQPLFRGVGDVQMPHVEIITDVIGLLVGDLELSKREDALSAAWPLCQNGDEMSFRKMSAFSRAIKLAAEAFKADVVLIDVGPNFGALNRAALLSSDFLVVPLGADLFSLQGLRNMGPTLREWAGHMAGDESKEPGCDPFLSRGADGAGRLCRDPALRPVGSAGSRFQPLDRSHPPGNMRPTSWTLTVVHRSMSRQIQTVSLN